MGEQSALARRFIPARPSRGLAIAVGVVLVLIIAIAASTTYWPSEKPIPGQRVAFNPAAYGQSNYASKIVPVIEARAVDFPVIAQAIAADPDAAGTKYGKRDGTSPWTYSVRVTGVAGAPVNGLLPITVAGAPAGVRVSVQIGPAINGTALRDATGTITFNDFVNQVDYADAATALNQEMSKELLASLQPASLAGKTVTVVGATSPLTAKLFTVTAVSIKVSP